MSDWSNEVKDIILQALPNLSSDVLQQIVSKLQSSGLESKNDLQYVQKDDLQDLLPVIQLRKLLQVFKSEAEVITLDLQAISSPCSRYSQSSSSSPLSSPTPDSQACMSFSPETANPGTSSSHTFTISKTWPTTFQVSWDRMPPEIQSAIAAGKRPKPAERRQMVRVLVDEMRKYELCPTRSQCITVCQNIVRQYPNSFADQFPNGALIAGGYTSLLLQVKTRVENLNRESSFGHHRRTMTKSGCKRGPTDTYGCVRFQPHLPPEETTESIEAKRQRLQDIYSKEGTAGFEKVEVQNLMETTFCLQRQLLNSTPSPSVEDIRCQWPYLFNQRSICAHFHLLTEIDILHTLEMSMEEFGKTIPEYFKSRPKDKNMKDVLSQADHLEIADLVIKLLLAHFNESESGLILHADVSATAADVEKMENLPASPRLILCGSADNCIERWMITLEGLVVCEGIQPRFLTAIATMFAMFYVFNLQYPEEACGTLEFIQRRFVGINPERGSKARRGKVISKKTGKLVSKKSATVNPKVASLLKNLIDFEWDFV
ncbi:uncharacterized protein LOC143732575 [Siphateles boraxobius]|uniref:uncharacterized protein LOC143732575 n=1 Tax=Siphateles boraxobius TaxID=180520 RepID=UPI0040648555